MLEPRSRPSGGDRCDRGLTSRGRTDRRVGARGEGAVNRLRTGDSCEPCSRLRDRTREARRSVARCAGAADLRAAGGCPHVAINSRSGPRADLSGRIWSGLEFVQNAGGAPILNRRSALAATGILPASKGDGCGIRARERSGTASSNCSILGLREQHLARQRWLGRVRCASAGRVCGRR